MNERDYMKRFGKKRKRLNVIVAEKTEEKIGF
jgi:hypothetical protein